MADETSTFPTLAAKQWWALRDRFKRSMPSVVTPEYIESALNVNLGSARDIVNQLRNLRILDNENRPTDIAEDWRHDETYPKACKEILDAVYPEELRHAAPDPTEDRAAAERWFARRQKLGANAALKRAITYQIVADGDLSRTPEPPKAGKPVERRGQRTRSAKQVPEHRAKADPKQATPAQTQGTITPVTPAAAGSPASGPSLHIDVQIHIASDATAAQIDQIFASMARHLYKQSAVAND